MGDKGVFLFFVMILFINFITWNVYQNPLGIVLGLVATGFISLYAILTVYERMGRMSELKKRIILKGKKREERKRRKLLRR